MPDNPYGFAPPDDRPIPYMHRIKTYYQTLGYGKPYEWAHYVDSPFTPLKKPLSECKVGLIGTSEVAVRFDPETETDPIVEDDFRGIYAIPADMPTERFYSRTASFDRNATHLDDVNAYYPVDRLREAVADGRVAGMPNRFYGAYNNYSQRKVLTQEAPKVLEYCRADGIDALIMVPV